MTSKPTLLEQGLRSVEVEGVSSPLRTLEAVSWGYPIWTLACKLLENTTEKRIDSIDRKNKKIRRRSRAIEFFVLQKVNFGRLLYKPARKRIRQLRGLGMPTVIIRDAVIGRLICRETGLLRLNVIRSRIVLLLGVLWHVLSTGITAILVLFVMLLPSAGLMKVVLVSLLLLLFAYSVGFFNVLAIRQHSAATYLRSLPDVEDLSFGRKLRSVT